MKMKVEEVQAKGNPRQNLFNGFGGE